MMEQVTNLNYNAFKSTAELTTAVTAFYGGAALKLQLFQQRIKLLTNVLAAGKYLEWATELCAIDLQLKTDVQQLIVDIASHLPDPHPKIFFVKTSINAVTGNNVNFWIKYS